MNRHRPCSTRRAAVSLYDDHAGRQGPSQGGRRKQVKLMNGHLLAPGILEDVVHLSD